MPGTAEYNIGNKAMNKAETPTLVQSTFQRGMGKIIKGIRNTCSDVSHNNKDGEKCRGERLGVG